MYRAYNEIVTRKRGTKMEDEKFVTRTSPKSNFIYLSVISFVLAVLFSIAYYLLPQIRFTVFLLGALLCLCCLGTGVMLAFGPPVTLRFVKDELYISDSNGKEYNVYAVPASDFVFMQTPLEKKYNIGSLRIKHTVFWMFGVKNFQETKQYVYDHFPHWE